jgi:hypothetical protein
MKLLTLTILLAGIALASSIKKHEPPPDPIGEELPLGNLPGPQFGDFAANAPETGPGIDPNPDRGCDHDAAPGCHGGDPGGASAPEPGTVALIGVGLVVLALRARRR